ncbi:MAG TPA: pyridoxamine 5'-phosphate oxidase family protein [Jiangellaceae bacterium]|nr:pyridoxamine 5'-phosphate oxidase family protein [Jiangellaceae bacterium]
MATRIQYRQTGTGVTGESEIRAGSGDDGQQMAPSLTAEQVWQQVTKATFAVLSHVTPTGEPRSSGVLYRVVGGRLYVAVAPDSWKARHVPVSGQVAVTVPVRRGGLLSLVAPIPPATVSFHARAIVHAAGSAQAASLARKLGSLLPAERQDSVCLIEVIPEGEFVTYGLGVSLLKMRIPEAARARVPVIRS